MSRSDAYIKVECDKCHDEIEVELTSLARGGWDERRVDAALKREGWTTDGEKDYCEGCSEEVEEG